MIALNLQDALAARLKRLVDGWSLPAKGGGVRPVRVFRQFLPLPGATQEGGPEGPSVFDNALAYGEEDLERNFPCLLVKVDEVEDAGEGPPCRISARILAGVYDESSDCQGYRDGMNLMEAVRLDLLQNRFLEMKFRLAPPLKWYVFEEQPWPVFFACMDTKWETGRPAEQIIWKGGDWRNGSYEQRKES